MTDISTPRLRVAVAAIGCKLNQAEAEQMSRQFTAAGFIMVPPEKTADIYVLNTCTVTHIADRKCRNWLRQAHRLNPQAMIVAAGCYAERSGNELTRVEGINLVIGNERKADIIKIISEATGMRFPGVLASLNNTSSRTRAFIKIQDGCNNFCAYCIVPLVRGREKSVPAGTVMAEIRERITEGYREIVLTGTEIGSYRSEMTDLLALIKKILEETDIVRLRLSSLQPREITPELVSLWSDRRLCRHFHLSLQSGGDNVLQRMRRPYTTDDYLKSVDLIRRQIPEAAITTDIIVGFPGETEAEFTQSGDFCRSLEFARIHVFPFSPRPGTAAFRLEPRVPESVKKERSRKMLALARESASKFHQRFTGKTLPVLWESSRGNVWSGLTDNYIRVYTQSERDLTNLITPAHLQTVQNDGLQGEIAPL